MITMTEGEKNLTGLISSMASVELLDNDTLAKFDEVQESSPATVAFCQWIDG
jgi:hypothetical protein